MIRQSVRIGAIAFVLSLVVHIFSLTFTFSTTLESPQKQPANVSLRLGTSFEEIAEIQSQTVVPEPTIAPEPTVQTPPEPPEATAPTSQARVASPNPENTPTPDTGRSAVVQPDVTLPVTPSAGELPGPGQGAPAGEPDASKSDASVTTTIEPKPRSVPPTNSPAVSPPVETVLPSNAVSPAQTVPTPPKVSSPELPVIAALPTVRASPGPEGQLPLIAGEEKSVDDLPPQTRPTASLRPQTRPEALAIARSDSAAESAEPFADLRRPTEIFESPLTAYTEGRKNAFAGQRSGRQSGGLGDGGGRGPGNSDTTDYAGLVLVHLNRTPPIAVSTPGWARVIFRINPDGSLASVDIIDGSGSPDVDRAARAQIRLGVPFPRPPDGRSRMLNFVYQID